MSITMSPKELTVSLTKAMKHRIPVLIKGAPGQGKTDLVQSARKALGMDLILSTPVVDSPIDYKGMGAIVKGQAEFLPFGNLRKAVEAKKPTIYFMDDLGQAPASVQAAAMQLLLNGQVNGVKIPDHVVFMAATNRRQDRAGVTGVLEPVKSRFFTILELEASVLDWIDWAIDNKLPPELIVFIHEHQDLLNTNEATNDIVNHPCPRTWAHVAALIEADMTSLAELAGAVGEAAAIVLYGHLQSYNEMPRIMDIIEEPTKAPVPKDPAALYSVVNGLLNMIDDDDNVEAILTYGDRLPADFSMLLIKEARRLNPDIQNTAAFTKWALAHDEVLSQI